MKTVSLFELSRTSLTSLGVSVISILSRQITATWVHMYMRTQG
jgi:hypothetical protein